ncbi:MAG: HNH endonuclease, partial [Bacteroidales bacterium]|nr:HNH endonuclease [Bacteroidales bacterium]
MNLPINSALPINLLAACFNNTSATYKFYWLLSILQAIEQKKEKILKSELFARMVSNAWYTVNYFHVSFGKQDKLQQAIETIKELERFTVDENRESIVSNLTISENQITLTQLRYFNNQVPHWFLSPWFPKKEKSEIYIASKTFENKCVYALYDNDIQINPQWFGYLFDNISLLKSFCYWNLAIYLQAKNPNVPDIPNKLIKPAIRSSLNQQRLNFWNLVINEMGSVNCIYTGKKLTLGKFAVEHFIPYNFVSHDLIWNLIPADKSFNNKKSDKLPPLNKYFDGFYNLQRNAIEIIKMKNPKNKFLQDYIS